MSVSPEKPRGGFTLPNRPTLMAGATVALAAAGGGLAVLVTLTAVGWITAPHVGIGSGLAGVLRTAGLLWLVAHHVGFTVRGAGRIGMLPLGLVLLPGALLALAGRWVVRAGAVTRLRHAGYAAVALALPYTLLAAAQAAMPPVTASGRADRALGPGPGPEPSWEPATPGSPGSGAGRASAETLTHPILTTIPFQPKQARRAGRGAEGDGPAPG